MQPVYNNVVNECAPAHIVVGDGGNVEGLVKQFIDQPGRCEETEATKPNPPYQPQTCRSFLGPNGTYCPTSQPTYSAFREPSFGYGVLEVHNATTATWQWHSNEVCCFGVVLCTRPSSCVLTRLSSTQEPSTRVADEVVYVRNVSDECARQRAGVLAAQGS